MNAMDFVSPQFFLLPPKGLRSAVRSVSLGDLRGSGRRKAIVELPYSELVQFEQCSLQWRLAREGAPDSVASGMLFATCFRAAVFHYYRRVREGREVPADELLDVFEEQWLAECIRKNCIPIRWGTAEKGEGNVRALAARMFDAFLAERGYRSGSEVVSVAEPFRVEVGGGVPPVAGVIDLVETRIDGDGVRRLHLVRFKTSSRRCTLEEVGVDPLHLYGMAAAGMGLSQAHGLPVVLRCDLFTKVKKPEIISLAVNDVPRDFGRLAEKIRQCWRGMGAGICFPAPSWRCAACGYSRACAAWPSAVPSVLPSQEVRESVSA